LRRGWLSFKDLRIPSDTNGRKMDQISPKMGRNGAILQTAVNNSAFSQPQLLAALALPMTAKNGNYSIIARSPGQLAPVDASFYAVVGCVAKMVDPARLKRAGRYS
jgi:hypothetical protein